jgi:hypothetical protein
MAHFCFSSGPEPAGPVSQEGQEEATDAFDAKPETGDRVQKRVQEGHICGSQQRSETEKGKESTS